MDNNNSEEIFISKRVNAYSSDTNENFLSKDELKILIDEFKKENNYIMRKPINLAIDASNIHSEGGLLHLKGILSSQKLPNKYIYKINIWGFSESLERFPKSNYIFHHESQKFLKTFS